MSHRETAVAQYIRMSTERQDLSPLIQKQAISDFASANGFRVVRTYEDDARSGMKFDNRPALRQLIHDVTDQPGFEAVLVYDITRWGRFQDVDAAAYYEYHCRLHGVRLVYVAEEFGDDTSSKTALLKSARRAAAADYCRDLAIKGRAGQHLAISLGYHMGPLPAFGYRRCSVARDGKSRVILKQGQRKLALTDRIEWVLAPQPEVDLVRRICAAYARTRLEPWQIATLVAAEGWRTVRGQLVREPHILSLIRNEALIGNFVWGVSEQNAKRRIIQTTPSRNYGSVPRIIDDETWRLMQERLELSRDRATGATSSVVTSRSGTVVFGGVVVQPLSQAQRSRRSRNQARQRACQAREFGRGLASALTAEGGSASFDSGRCLLLLWSNRMRIKLLWQFGNEWGEVKDSAATEKDHYLLVRMDAPSQPRDFFVVAPRVLQTRLPRRLAEDDFAALAQTRCGSPRELLKKLRSVGT